MRSRSLGLAAEFASCTKIILLELDRTGKIPYSERRLPLWLIELYEVEHVFCTEHMNCSNFCLLLTLNSNIPAVQLVFVARLVSDMDLQAASARTREATFCVHSRAAPNLTLSRCFMFQGPVMRTNEEGLLGERATINPCTPPVIDGGEKVLPLGNSYSVWSRLQPHNDSVTPDSRAGISQRNMAEFRPRVLVIRFCNVSFFVQLV